MLISVDFIYFIDLNDPLVCVNLIRTNGLMSPSLIHLVTYKEEYPLYDCDLNRLLYDLDYEPIGFASPRLAILKYSKVAKNGYRLGKGEGQQWQFLSESETDHYHKIAQLEVDFERVRRIIAPKAASRLACLFLATNDYDGRVMLQNMFSTKKNFIIARVDVKYIDRFYRADSKWIDLYASSPNDTIIQRYWLGEASCANPTYEYLIEGIFYLKDIRDRETIRQNCSLDEKYKESN